MLLVVDDRVLSPNVIICPHYGPWLLVYVASLQKTHKAGDAAFVHYGPKLWNTLPPDVREPALEDFKTKLNKTSFSN